jgi:mRNA interferase RelE/StbE
LIRRSAIVTKRAQVKNLDVGPSFADTANIANVILTADALDRADRLPKTIHARILALTERLKRWPDVSGAKPLRGDLAGFYRMRTGDYRLRFFLNGKTVVVDKIGHRREFYED